ncbi:MAG: undecaprenyl-diphosphate phosphatase [Tissierellia bacterium]|nr:undecaprenyl-diphosphate phosphatase [Tissierellia bacterium]
MEVVFNILKVIILSIVEGVTEFLPVSSTGHLIIANEFVGLEPEKFANSFNVIIQLGAILSVVVIYFEKLNPFPKRKLKHGDWPEKLKNPETKNLLAKKVYYWFTHNRTVDLWLKIVIAVLPSMVLGLIFDDKIDELLFKPVPVAIALIFYGVIIILLEEKNRKKSDYKYSNPVQVSYKTAFLIGCFQVLAMWPGTSRSAATIIGAMILGLSRPAAAEFSFFLAIPTMVGATLLKLIKMESLVLGQWLMILLGFILSFIVAYIVVKKFLSYVQKNDFKVFGYYRVILGLLVLILVLTGVFN